MTRIAIVILAFFTGSAVLWGGLEAIKASSYAAGDAAARADVERARADAVAAAVAQAEKTRAGLAQRAEQAEAEAIAREAELKGMRDELAKLGGGDPVVFDGGWACWVRGERCTVAGRGR